MPGQTPPGSRRTGGLPAHDGDGARDQSGGYPNCGILEPGSPQRGAAAACWPRLRRRARRWSARRATWVAGTVGGRRRRPRSISPRGEFAYSAPGFPDAWRGVQFLENQDLTYAGHSGAARVPMLADGADRRSWYARSRSRVVTSLLFAAPGIPSLFMGEEFLEDKNWSDDRSANGLIWWDGLDGPDPAMRDFLRCVTDLVQLRRTQPALRAAGARVSRVQNYDRVIVLHRWVEWEGRDVVVVASLDETPKHGYAIRLPFAGEWSELFNSDVYDNFPNPGAVGNGGAVQASGAALDGFSASAALTVPANGVIMLARQRR